MAEYKLPFTGKEIEDKLIFDTTLTQEGRAADALSVGNAIANINTKVDIYVIVGDLDTGEISKLLIEDALAQQFGMAVTVHKQIVKTLPSTLTQSDLQNGIVYLYILEDTGIVYGDIGDGAVTLGYALIGQNWPNNTENFDHGWITDINSEEAWGVYCIRSNAYDGGKYIIRINSNDDINNAITSTSLTSEDCMRIQNDFFNTAFLVTYSTTTPDNYQTTTKYIFMPTELNTANGVAGIYTYMSTVLDFIDNFFNMKAITVVIENGAPTLYYNTRIMNLN